MSALREHLQELRDRAMRLNEARKEDPELSLNAAVVRVGQRLGVNSGTLRGWMRQAQIGSRFFARYDGTVEVNDQIDLISSLVPRVDKPGHSAPVAKQLQNTDDRKSSSRRTINVTR